MKRDLQMSRNLVMDIQKTLESRRNDSGKSRIASMMITKIPEIQKCLDGIENNRADSLIRLIALLSDIRDYAKPGTTWFSYVMVIEQDLTIFFEENYDIDLSMIERLG